VLRFCHEIMMVWHHTQKIADILAGNAVMGSSQCFSDQRFAICCLRRGDGNVCASLLIKNPAALVPCVVCDPCAMLVC
jgi:hypothetical protein